jgi:hypothetical protein
MTVSHAFLVGLAATHLVLVACGAGGWTLVPDDTPANRWLRLYGELSGADNRYGFFAPAVGSQLRTLFTLQDEQGRTWTDTHEHGRTHEGNLRFGGLTDAAWAHGNLDPVQLRSWAAAMLGRHPTATSVTICIQAYSVPTMSDYRFGKRPEWLPVYETTYARVGPENLEGD